MTYYDYNECIRFFTVPSNEDECVVIEENAWRSMARHIAVPDKRFKTWFYVDYVRTLESDIL